MEYCEKGDLLELLLKEGRAMNEKRVVNEIAIPLLTTLSWLHEYDIIHRDIKLENIFVASDGTFKLGDFGLTMSLREERAISPVGTLEYMAPELVKLPAAELIINGTIKADDIESVDFKVDIWALGVTIFELVTGRSPFEGQDKAEIKMNIINFNIRKFPMFLSAECQDFIKRMLTFDPKQRPSAVKLLQHQWIRKLAKTPIQVTPQNTMHATVAGGQLRDKMKESIRKANMVEGKQQTNQGNFSQTMQPKQSITFQTQSQTMRPSTNFGNAPNNNQNSIVAENRTQPLKSEGGGILGPEIDSLIPRQEGTNGKSRFGYIFKKFMGPGSETSMTQERVTPHQNMGSMYRQFFNTKAGQMPSGTQRTQPNLPTPEALGFGIKTPQGILPTLAKRPSDSGVKEKQILEDKDREMQVADYSIPAEEIVL